MAVGVVRFCAVCEFAAALVVDTGTDEICAAGVMGDEAAPLVAMLTALLAAMSTMLSTILSTAPLNEASLDDIAFDKFCKFGDCALVSLAALAVLAELAEAKFCGWRSIPEIGLAGMGVWALSGTPCINVNGPRSTITAPFRGVFE